MRKCTRASVCLREAISDARRIMRHGRRSGDCPGPSPGDPSTRGRRGAVRNSGAIVRSGLAGRIERCMRSASGSRGNSSAVMGRCVS